MSDPTTGSPIARRTSTGTGHFEINGCPDSQGVSPGTYTLLNQEEVTGAGGTSNGGASTTNATFRVLNGDDAHLIETDAQITTAAGAHGTDVSAVVGPAIHSTGVPRRRSASPSRSPVPRLSDR